MIINSKVHIGLPTNFTTMGSEIQLFCGNQINKKSASPVFTAICGENGAWSPNISDHIKCAMDEESSDSEFNIASWLAQTPHYAWPVPMYALNEISRNYL